MKSIDVEYEDIVTDICCCVVLDIVVVSMKRTLFDRKKTLLNDSGSVEPLYESAEVNGNIFANIKGKQHVAIVLNVVDDVVKLTRELDGTR